MIRWGYRVEFMAHLVLTVGQKYLVERSALAARKMAAIDAIRLIGEPTVNWDYVRPYSSDGEDGWDYERCQIQQATLFVLTLTFDAEPPVDVVPDL